MNLKKETISIITVSAMYC